MFFAFDVKNEGGVIPECSNTDVATKVYLTYAQGYCASDWIIKNSNLDYLKVDSNGKCPNNKSLGYDSGQVTSCK